MKTLNKLSALCLGLALAAGCTVEETGPSGDGLRTFGSVPVSFTLGASGDARSAVSIDDDAISSVALFVFDAVSGKICLNRAGEPFATERHASSFTWELPCREDGTPLDVDIYTICNYGDRSLPLTDPNLTAAELDGWTFRISEVRELDRGMPMGGIDRLSLLPTTRSVVLHVNKLFACFFFEFDLSELEAASLSLQALHLTTHQVNPAVHWFHSGDKAAETVSLDYATDTDLRYLGDGGDACVYVPENLQGTIPGASDWRHVLHDLGTRVSRCTYVDISVKVVDAEGLYENRNFQVYLGGDMVSDFDIPRNLSRTVRIRIPANNPEPDFSWDRKQIVIEPGQTKEAGYRSGFPLSQLSFRADGEGCTVVSDEFGKARISIAPDIPSGTVFIVEGGSGFITATMKVIARDSTFLSCTWTDRPKYVGYPANFRIEGLRSGETLTGVDAGHSRSIVQVTDGASVRFVPGAPGSERLTVTTSYGRSLSVDTPEAVLPALVAEETVRIPIDGSYVFPDIHYADPVTGARLDGFDPVFYDRYLNVTENSVSPLESCPADLVRSVCSGTGIAVYSYAISGYVTGKKVAEVTVRPVDYEGLSGIVGVEIEDPGIREQDLGELHDYGLIPSCGERAEDEEEVLSLEGNWDPSALGVDPSAILFPLVGDGLVVEGTENVTVRSDGTPGPGTVSVRIRNRFSGETVTLPLFQARKHLHLAIGGVRSSDRNLGQSEGEMGSRKGERHTYFLGAADFASRYPGSEADRFSDWPAEARTLAARFESGGDLAGSVRPAGTGYVHATSGGYASVVLTTTGIYGGAGNPGIQIQLYAVHRFGSGADLPDPPPYHRFTGYDTPYIHVHDYGDLYPSSNGWLPDMASGFAGWTEM